MAKVDKNIRRIKYLTHKMHLVHWSFTVRDRVNEILSWDRIPASFDRAELEELKLLLDNTVISQQELVELFSKTQQEKGQRSYKFNQTPIIRRDNKGVRIGSGGSGRTIRYPSQKRSLRTWKIFYSMFPYYAEKDNWDGKTSNKMKKS